MFIINIAIIKNNVCIDNAVFDDFETALSFFKLNVWTEADSINILPDGFGIGDSYVNGEWIKKEVEYENTEPTLEELKIQTLAALDTEYDPQFDALTLAWATAFMDGKTQIAAARLTDKQILQKEYEAKKEAILNG